MFWIQYGRLFSEKGALQNAPLLKTTLGRKKATKTENSQISPRWCALWVHILGRPFSASRALMYMFVPSYYDVPNIRRTDDIMRAMYANFRNLTIFSDVFTRKKPILVNKSKRV